MILNEFDIASGKQQAPAKPEVWLGDVPNQFYFLCWLHAADKYDDLVKEGHAFLSISPERQGAYAAAAMVELLTLGFQTIHGEKYFRGNIAMYERFYCDQPNREFWVYERKP